MRNMYVATIRLDFPLGLSNSLYGCENPGAFLFKNLMKPLLYMRRIPLRGQVFSRVSNPVAVVFKASMKPLL